MLDVKHNQPQFLKAVTAAFEDVERGAYTSEVEDRCATVEWNGGRLRAVC